MAKTRTVYICNSCGAESSQWFGKCPSCDVYGSLEEVIVNGNSNSNGHFSRGGWQSNTREHNRRSTPAQPRTSVKFSEIVEEEQARMNSGYQELDRVLGGGERALPFGGTQECPALVDQH